MFSLTLNSCNQYAWVGRTMPHSIHNLEQEPKNPIIFDKGEILPSHDDPLVITIQVMSYEIRRVIIDKLSSSNPM